MHLKYKGLPEVAVKIADLYWGKEWTLGRLSRRFKLSPAQCREYAFEVRLRREMWDEQNRAVRTILKAGARHRARGRARAQEVAAAV